MGLALRASESPTRYACGLAVTWRRLRPGSRAELTTCSFSIYLPLQIRLGRTQVPVLDNLLAIEQHRPVVCTA